MAERSKKDGFWTRIRHQYGNASAALSNLSLNSHETDGDNENDTVVHHALYRYYMKEDGAPPQWLGVIEPPQQQYMRPTNPEAQGDRPAQVYRTHTTGQSSSLQDIYNRRRQNQSPNPTSAGSATSASSTNPHRPLPRSQTFNGTSGNSDGEKTDRFKNRLKSAGRANW